MSTTKKHQVAIHWFRKGLRLHDNPSLLEACTTSSKVYPIFIIDPWFAKPDKVGINRYSFLLESLADLDASLRSIGSRLYIIRGKPEEQIPILIQKWGVDLLTYEKDTEPYAVQRDSMISASLPSGVKVSSFCSHTLFETEHYLAINSGKIPTTYTAFCKLFLSMGSVRQPLTAITSAQMPSSVIDPAKEYSVPTLAEMGYTGVVSHKFPGGETEALKRLREKVSERPQWACQFEKPSTSPNSLEASTTVLSPYLKFGCISATLFYQELARIYKSKPHSQPPMSLHGQLLWREFFYFSSVVTPNFDKMKGNSQCKQIPWGEDAERYAAFKEGRTGYPFIDAIMAQLRTEGWIHHLARHSVACFFTRGDLWQHWEKGAEIFDLYLLDSDWALNHANWQWLSCSRFFYQYFRCYSPVAFGKKTDPNGDYIRKYLPELSKYPAKYIYEPWKAPLNVQQDCGCIVGKGYPKRIVDHDIAVKENMAKLKIAYADHSGGGDDDDVKPPSNAQKGKPKFVLIKDILSPPQKKKK